MLDESMAQLVVEWRLRSSVTLRNPKIKERRRLVANTIPDIYIYAYEDIYIRCSSCPRLALKAASKVKVTRPERLALSRCWRYEVNVRRMGIRMSRRGQTRARERIRRARDVGCEHSPRGSISRFWSMYVVGVSPASAPALGRPGLRMWMESVEQGGKGENAEQGGGYVGIGMWSSWKLAQGKGSCYVPAAEETGRQTGSSAIDNNNKQKE